MEYILVGRHTGSTNIGGYEIAEQRNILWDTKGCDTQWATLQNEAQSMGMGILLQNAPGILVGAMIRQGFQVNTGIIVSEMVTRESNVSKTFPFVDGREVGLAIELTKFVNGRAKAVADVAGLVVTVDPVKDFVFDHIEWLF